MVKERDRKSWVEETEMGGEGWGELKHNLRSGCTHRGGWAIGPGSTPPSFVLTPAAFPPVRLVPLALPLSATSVVAHVWGEVAWIVTFSCSMWLPVSVTVSISALISQASVSLAVSSVKWPVLRGAIVIATTESEDRGWWATTPKKKRKICRDGIIKYIFSLANIPPWACITSFLSVSPSSSVSVSVSVTTGWISGRPSVPVSSPSVSVSVTVLVAASTVSVRRRVSSIVRHLVDYKRNKLNIIKIKKNSKTHYKVYDFFSYNCSTLFVIKETRFHSYSCSQLSTARLICERLAKGQDVWYKNKQI